MHKIELKASNFLKKNMLFIGGVLIIIASLMIRFFLRGWLDGDMKVFLIPWQTYITEQGIAATMKLPGCNYNVAYLSLLALTSKLPITSIVSIKIISVLFDYLAAAVVAWLIYDLMPQAAKNRKIMAIASFVIVSVLPIPVFNSAMWGQCDIIYTCFLILSTRFLIKEKYTLAFLFFAVGVCFKLQAIFFLPVLVILYFVKQKFSILQFLQVPLLLTILGFFGRQKGDSFFYGLTVYFQQTQDYKQLTLNYPNIFMAFAYADYNAFAPAGIMLTLVVFTAMLVYILYKKWDIKGDALVLLAVWSILTCVCFLPAMHDRYGFAAELMIWIFFLAKPNLRRFVLAMAVNFVPLTVYVRTFMEVGYLTQLEMSLVNLMVYAGLTIVLIMYLRKNGSKKILGGNDGLRCGNACPCGRGT